MLVPHNGTINPPQTSKTCMFVKRCKNCGLARHDGCDVCEEIKWQSSTGFVLCCMAVCFILF